VQQRSSLPTLTGTRRVSAHRGVFRVYSSSSSSPEEVMGRRTRIHKLVDYFGVITVPGKLMRLFLFVSRSITFKSSYEMFLIAAQAVTMPSRPKYSSRPGIKQLSSLALPYLQRSLVSQTWDY
jgi:hypothetical protein